MAHFASAVKCNWTPDPTALILNAQDIYDAAQAKLRAVGIEDEPSAEQSAAVNGFLRTLPAESTALLLRDSISPLPLHKSLVLLDAIAKLASPALAAHMKLALAKTAVHCASNLRFGPEVGLGKIKCDAAVLAPWFSLIQSMSDDLIYLRHQSGIPVEVHLGDARDAGKYVEPSSVAAVITSPPYPNEKDYTRTTRLESVLLGFLNTKDELRKLKATLVRSNTRGVYKADNDDKWVDNFPEIARLAHEIESRRIELAKTSGFEKLYARVTRLYFGGMARHLAGLRPVLKKGAKLAYVVGDQASYFRILIRTANILGEIASDLGYRVEDIQLFRTRAATATKTELREEILILSWPGGK